MPSVKVFYSYAHEDQHYQEQLIKHLRFLERTRKIDGWYDRRIAPGSNWEEEINYNLDAARVILMLLSPDFINSDYCYETETIRAFEKHKAGTATVIPIIVRPCLWRETAFSKTKALPLDGNPISSYDDQDAAWLEVAEGILAVVNEILAEEEPAGDGEMVVAAQPKGNKKDDDIIRLLCEHKDWYFSPHRIMSKSKLMASVDLEGLTEEEVKKTCESLVEAGKLKSTTSAQGNVIFKIDADHADPCS